ncbi:DUF5615 family PIN-like protein [Thermosulfurimonas sp. F29]|uniref:DUF5615 family PIN-like protein n=1 Tax=Thermosulfurimonas sp. F29 TaxID=2867247 RepID=UPI001C83584E|nr:DUF5615 family PIN-like protein [Thermosulfurimonas sp. F29]MBX6423143.1 DUF5615 family PIN-like protein [Thermosulfurimonas sp. F29]
MKLREYGIEAIHWSEVGSLTATDREIFSWAREREYVVVTHDLDFGAILAATHAKAPSVVQIRTLNVKPEVLAPKILDLLQKFEDHLRKGALMVLEETRSRVRILPL